MNELFEYFDADKSGMMDKEELKAAFRALDIDKSDSELSEIINK